MTESWSHAQLHAFTGTTSSVSIDHAHPLPWEGLERKIAELEARLESKRAQLAAWSRPQPTTY